MRFSILAVALAAHATLAISKDHIKHHLESHKNHEVAAPTSWPSVIVPFNFEYEVNAYNYNPVTHEMTIVSELGYH